MTIIDAAWFVFFVLGYIALARVIYKQEDRR